MAHIQTTRLFGKADRIKQSHAERWKAVGQVRWLAGTAQHRAWAWAGLCWEAGRLAGMQ